MHMDGGRIDILSRVYGGVDLRFEHPDASMRYEVLQNPQLPPPEYKRLALDLGIPAIAGRYPDRSSRLALLRAADGAAAPDGLDASQEFEDMHGFRDGIIDARPEQRQRTGESMAV